MQDFIKWQSVENLPEKWEYILIETKYCKYPCIVGFYDGVNFRSAENKNKIMNCEFWQQLKLR